MTDDGDDIWGRNPAKPTFTQRLTGAAPQASVPPALRELPEGDLPLAHAGTGAYKPYSYLPTRAGGDYFDALTWTPGTTTPEGVSLQYRFVTGVHFVGTGTLRLTTPDTVVLIEGRHLDDLRQKLNRRLVTRIQQYHPRLWPHPPADEPVIELLEIKRPRDN